MGRSIESMEECNMEKIIGTEVIHYNRYAKVLVEPTVSGKYWVRSFCYKCDVGRHILMCDYCGKFHCNGYFKYIGDGGL